MFKLKELPTPVPNWTGLKKMSMIDMLRFLLHVRALTITVLVAQPGRFGQGLADGNSLTPYMDSSCNARKERKIKQVGKVRLRPYIRPLSGALLHAGHREEMRDGGSVI